MVFKSLICCKPMIVYLVRWHGMKVEKRMDQSRSVGWLTRIDPITKGVWVFSTGLASMLTDSVTGQAVWLLLVLLIAWTGAGWSSRRWRLVLGWCLGFGLPLIGFQWLVLPGHTPLIDESFGRWFTREALLLSIALTLRTLIMFMTSILFASTTEPRDVVAALVLKLHVPPKFAYAAALALRFVPLLAREAEQIKRAQELRALTPKRGLGSWLKRMRQLILAVIQAALREVHTVSIAMEAKCFGKGTRTQRRKLHISMTGKLFAIGSLGAMLLSIWLF